MLIIAILLTCGIVVASVSLHYEALRFLSKLILAKRKRWYSNRLRASLVVLGCLVIHAIEVLFFGLGYQFLELQHQGSDLKGDVPSGFNCAYYSFVVYTSIGFGDVVPVSPSLRFMTGVEGLTGAILVAWTASFLFFHMGRFWEIDLKRSQSDP